MLEFYPPMLKSIRRYLNFNNRIFRIAFLIVVSTAMVALAVFHSQILTQFILMNQTPILITGIIVLTASLAFQKKQTDMLRENEKLYRELQKKQEIIDRDLKMASVIQQGILQEKIPEVRGIKLLAKCIPAATIGGDFYGIRKVDGEIHFFMGDVSGHGISSALVMALTYGVVSELSVTNREPAKILSEANRILCRYLDNNINFVTLFYGILEPKTKSLVYASAGHPAALLFGREKYPQKMLTATGGILGKFRDNKFKSKSLKLNSGDKLIVYTDGFLENQDEVTPPWGEKGFIDILGSNISQSTAQLGEVVFREATKRTKAVVDDLSLLIMELE